MARQQTGETTRNTERGKTSAAARGAANEARTGKNGGSAGSERQTMEAGELAGGLAGASREQERARQVSQEGSTGTGMQRGGARQPGNGGALAGRGGSQPSLLPAFMAHPGLMASAFMSDPFAFANVMNDEMERLFSTFGASGAPGLQRSSGRQGAHASSWNPQMEIVQRGNELAVRADLPGLAPDDVHIDVQDGVLTIAGERRQKAEERQEGFYRSERSYGAFSRSIPLPDGVDEDRIEARFEHGVLEVTVPMPQENRQRGRRIQIQSGASGSSGQVRSGPGFSAPSSSGRQASTESQPH